MINKLKNLIELEKEAYLELMVVARQEAYIYFDKNIRELPRKKDGSFDETKGGSPLPLARCHSNFPFFC